MIDARETARRFPAYRLPPELPVLFQPDGGFLVPERCIVAHVNGAIARGAVVRAREHRAIADGMQVARLRYRRRARG